MTYVVWQISYATVSDSSQPYFTAIPLLLPWLSRSVLVVAMVSASAMRDICSIRVKPGRLEWRRWLDRTWACSGPNCVGLYWDRSMTYTWEIRQKTNPLNNCNVFRVYKTVHAEKLWKIKLKCIIRTFPNKVVFIYMKNLNSFQQSKSPKTPALFPVSSSLLSKGSRSAMLGVLKSSS